MNRFRFLHGIVILLIASPTHGGDGPTIRIPGSGVVYVFHPNTNQVHVEIEGKAIPILRGIGPVWQIEGREHSPLTCEVQPAQRKAEKGKTDIPYATAEGNVRWHVALHAGDEKELVIDLRSDTPGILLAQPGEVITGGKWTGLDLNQYQVAHGQPWWPKTYYLHKPDLFLCVWWDWQVSNASLHDWPAKECDTRTGEGPFAPAADMVYLPGPDGKRPPLREALHVRVGRRLWDVALPSLCEPSEYRNELAQMVYLDFWGNSTAAELKHALRCLEQLAGPHVRLLTIVQNWQAGGFDVLLPDSLWMPDYPPNPAIGTVQEFRELADVGKRLGRFGFRTNYMICRDQAPSVRRGIVTLARGPDGKPKWHTQPARWDTLAERQEKEIARLWQPTASFTDQLASGGCPKMYTDFGPGGDSTLSSALRRQWELARLIKVAHNGPLGSETLNQQDLIGTYCDFGDYGFMNGHNRLFSPDYKLRRLQGLTMFFGCGLYYRFFEPSPFKQFHAGTLPLWDDPALMDDYRCCEVILGNGAYVFWKAPWTWVLTECILVGRLQRHYALQPVESIECFHNGEWQDLEAMVRAGFAPQTRAWLQKQEGLGRIRVRYGNGLTVYANRLPGEITVETPRGPLVLPQYGWVAFRSDDSLMAYSAFRPGTQQRVDFLDERSSRLRFLNPRGAPIEGSTDMRLWKDGQLLWSFDAETETATVLGRTITLNPQPEPLTEIDIDFTKEMNGVQATHGVLRVEPTAGGQRLVIVSNDPYLFLPPVAIDGERGDVIELTMSTDAGTMGQLYFRPSKGGVRMVSYEVVPDGALHTITIPVGRHPDWAGARIVKLRLDPVHGPPSSTVVLHSVRLRHGGEKP